MEELYLEKTLEIKKKRKKLEEKLNVKISISGKKVTIEGETLNEYDASKVLNAISFGFSADKAILLKNSEYSYREIKIKDFTTKKNLETIRARLIGKHGKTKETIEKISNSKIIIKDNYVGIISLTEEIEHTITAIVNIIKGSKQSNVYGYLERINRIKRNTE